MNERKKVSNRRRFEVFRRDGYQCRYCGFRPEPGVLCELVVDHVVPVAAGGTNDVGNLVAACERCNSGKSAESVSPVLHMVNMPLGTPSCSCRECSLFRRRQQHQLARVG